MTNTEKLQVEIELLEWLFKNSGDSKAYFYAYSYGVLTEKKIKLEEIIIKQKKKPIKAF